MVSGKDWPKAHELEIVFWEMFYADIEERNSFPTAAGELRAARPLYGEHAGTECVSLFLGHWQPAGKCQKSLFALRRKEKTQGTVISPNSFLGLQQIKETEWAWEESGVWGKKCSMGFSTRQSLFAAALPPASPLCLCSGGSLLCSCSSDSVSCGQAKGPLQGSVRCPKCCQEEAGAPWLMGSGPVIP